MTEPVNRTILLFDIERFGRRDDVEQTFLRRKLHDVVEDTLASAGVERTAQHREDRGDAVLVLISSEVSKVRLLRSLLTGTPEQLHSYNRLAASSAQIRLRIVLASGEVALHQQPGTLGGAVGHDLNQAFRLLDAEPLRRALRESTEDSVLCVSASVHQGVVRHGHLGVRAEHFRPVTVEGKEGELTAWLHDARGAREAGREPDGAVTAGLDGPAGENGPSPRSAGEGPGAGTDSGERDGTGRGADAGEAAATSAAVVLGDQYGVAGGRVTGDLNFTFDRGDRR